MKIDNIIAESQHKCPHCGGPVVEYSELMEKKDACYYKVKASAKVWPSAYASGRLVQCRKKGASNYGNKNENIEEASPNFVDKDGNRIPPRQPSNQPLRPFGQPGDAKSWAKGVVTYTPTGLVHRSNHGDVTPKPRAVEQAANPAQQAAIAIAKKKKKQGMAEGGEAPEKELERLKLRQNAEHGRASLQRQADTQARIRELEKAQKNQGVAEGNRPFRGVGGAFDRGDDERHDLDPTDWYFVKDGKMFAVAVYPNQEQQAIERGYSRTRAEAKAKADQQGIAEGAQRVDSLVTDALKIMRGSEASDAVAALKTVLGDREYNSRRGHYNFYVRQLMDMSGQQGMAEDYNPEYDDEAGMADNNLETLDRAVQGIDDLIQSGDNLPEWCQEKIANAKSMLVAVWDYMYSEEASDEVDPEIDAMFEAMDQLAEEMAIKNRVSKDLVWEQFESMPDNMLYETAAWRRKEGKSKKGGLNAKGVASYRRENPGSKLQMAVTTKPSKLKPGSKAAKRRKSFCARMGGVKGPMKKPNGKPTRKALALRKWNC